MEPYEGLFGFEKNAEYNGTIFRLPFRSNPSELSSTCYMEATVKNLFDDILESGDTLLLFLQKWHLLKVYLMNPIIAFR